MQRNYLTERERTKRSTINQPRLQHRNQAAFRSQKPDDGHNTNRTSEHRSCNLLKTIYWRWSIQTANRCDDGGANQPSLEERQANEPQRSKGSIFLRWMNFVFIQAKDHHQKL